jgi:hypothetical protein
LRFPAGTQRPATLVQSFHAIVDAAKALHQAECRPKQSSDGRTQDVVDWARQEVGRLSTMTEYLKRRQVQRVMSAAATFPERTGALLRELWGSPHLVDLDSFAAIVMRISPAVRNTLRVNAKKGGDVGLAEALDVPATENATRREVLELARSRAAIQAGVERAISRPPKKR